MAEHWEQKRVVWNIILRNYETKGIYLFNMFLTEMCSMYNWRALLRRALLQWTSYKSFFRMGKYVIIKKYDTIFQILPSLRRAQSRAPFDGGIISLKVKSSDTNDNVKAKIDNVKANIEDEED
jgi:hypothetical protein